VYAGVVKPTVDFVIRDLALQEQFKLMLSAVTGYSNQTESAIFVRKFRNRLFHTCSMVLRFFYNITKR